MYYLNITKGTTDPKGKGFWLAKIGVKNTIIVTNKISMKLIGNDLKTTWNHLVTTLGTTLILLGDYLETNWGRHRDNLGTSFWLLVSCLVTTGGPLGVPFVTTWHLAVSLGSMWDQLVNTWVTTFGAYICPVGSLWPFDIHSMHCIRNDWTLVKEYCTILAAK